jgi:hypothetical protein
MSPKNPPSSNDYLRAIGDLSVSFAWLEKLLGLFVGELLTSDGPAGLHVTSGSEVTELVAMFRSLFLYRVDKEPLRKKCVKLCGQIENLKDSRNRYLHSQVVLLANAQGFTEAQRSKMSKRNKHGLTVDLESDFFDSLTSLSRDIRRAEKDLIGLVIESRPLIKEHLAAHKLDEVYPPPEVFYEKFHPKIDEEKT